MKSKKYIWIIALVILSSLAFASSQTPTDYIFWDNGDQISYTNVSGTYNAAPADEASPTTQRWQTYGGADGFKYDSTDANKLGNMSLYILTSDAGQQFRMSSVSGLSNVTLFWQFYDNMDTAAETWLGFMANDSAVHFAVGIYTVGCANGYNSGWDANTCYNTVPRSLGYSNLSIEFAPYSDWFVLRINGTVIVNNTANKATLFAIVMRSKPTVSGMLLENIRVWSGSYGSPPEAQAPPPPDTTPPKLLEINVTPEGGLGQKVNLSDPLCLNAGCRVPRTNDTTPTLTANFSESATAGLTDNRTQTYVQCTTTGALVNICTESTILPVGLSNITLNWSDSSGNKNQTMFSINITDAEPPAVIIGSLLKTYYTVDLNNTGLIFNWSSTDNYFSSYTISVNINGTGIYSNSTFLNGTDGKVSFSRGLGNWNITIVLTDGMNNANQTSQLFKVANDNIAPNTFLISPPTGVLYRLGINNTITFSFNSTDNMNTTLSCIGYIDNSAVYTNTSYLNGTTGRFISTQGVGTHNWTVNCTDSYNNKNQSEMRNFTIPQLDINITLKQYSNNTLIYNLYNVQFNFTVNFTEDISICRLYINNSINATNLSLIRSEVKYNLTVPRLESRKDYKWQVGCSAYGNEINSSFFILTTDPFGLLVRITTGVNFTFRPYIINSTLRVANLSCSGQNLTIGCLNLSITSPQNLNFSLLFNITTDPKTQRILDDFDQTISNWSVFQSRSKNIVNNTIVNDSIKCAEIVNLNTTGLLRYRFNNSGESVYLNASNISIKINMTFNCTNINYFTRILNGTQTNTSGFDTFNFTWKGDNTTNVFNITLIDNLGNKISSPSLSLANTDYNLSGIDLGNLKNISTINISISNKTSTLGLNQFFLGDLKLMNSTSNQSGNIKMKASCTGYYHNSTLLVPNVWTNLCVVPANTTTKFIWLFQDINLTKKGLAWKLQYNVTILGG